MASPRQSRGLTPGLRAWAESVVGEIQSTTDESWEHASSDITRLELAQGKAAYLKRHGSPTKYGQERGAYARWCPFLPNCAPLLGETTEPALAMIVGAMPGRPLLGRSGTDPGALPIAEQVRAYRKAGEFLADLHALPAKDEDSVSIPRAWQLRAEAWAHRGKDQVGAREIDGVLSLAHGEWPDGLPVPDRVPCHRDFTERNWLVDGTHFTVIDFEHARLDWSLVDVERALSSIQGNAEELRRAFLGGYGWRDTPQDAELLRRVGAVAALTQVVWAIEHNDAPFERRGRARLEQALRP